MFSFEARVKGFLYRFFQMNAFKKEYKEVADIAISKLSEEEIESTSSQLDRCLEKEHEHLRAKHKIPKGVYLVGDEPIREADLSSFTEDIEGWADGTLTQLDSAILLHHLDLQELDEYYILLGIPNASFSSFQRDLLEKVIVEMGCGCEDDFQKVNKLFEKFVKVNKNS